MGIYYISIKMNTDQKVQEQADMMAEKEINKAPLIKKDNQHWDSADQHAVQKNSEEKENMDTAEDEMMRQAELAMKKGKKQKQPLLKKDKTHWDSASNHYIKKED